jgi:hypothetical protein
LTGYLDNQAFAVNFVLLVRNLSTGATRGGWDIPEVTRCQYLFKAGMLICCILQIKFQNIPDFCWLISEVQLISLIGL